MLLFVACDTGPVRVHAHDRCRSFALASDTAVSDRHRGRPGGLRSREEFQQAVRICSMDNSSGIRPSQLPQRTHVVVVPESEWERVVVKWFNRQGEALPHGVGNELHPYERKHK